MRAVVLGIALAFPALAAADTFDFDPLFGAAFNYGGDTMITLSYSDGSSESVTAGDGTTFYLGTFMDLPVEGLQLRATAGYKTWNSKDATNYSLRKSMFPVEFGLQYNYGDFFVSGGLAHHLNAGFDQELNGNDSEWDIDVTPGYSVHAGWKYLILGYSDLTYEDENQGGAEYSASSFSLGIQFTLSDIQSL